MHGANAILAAAGYNFRLLLAWLAGLLSAILILFCSTADADDNQQYV